MTRLIVKVQIPLESTIEINPPCLVYNEDRSINVLLPITPDVLRLMAGYPKKYFEAVIRPDNQLELMKEVGPQPW